MTGSSTILGKWAYKKSDTLKNLLLNRLHRLQNPDNCQEKKFMICGPRNDALTGSQLHSLLLCMISAFAFNRTLIIENDTWKHIGTRGIKGFFESLGKNCSYNKSDKTDFDFSNITYMSKYKTFL